MSLAHTITQTMQAHGLTSAQVATRLGALLTTVRDRLNACQAMGGAS